MSRKRLLTISLVVVVVVICALGSWIVGSSIRSPAEAAARTAPPTPSPILVPVEERMLTSDIVTRGTARFGLPIKVVLAPSDLKSGGGVITTLPERGTQVYEGDVLLTVSGRPVFIFQGEIPVYRDLVPGIVGDDVLQLEGGLARMGFDPGPMDGVFDELTSTAVSNFYTAAGRQPFGATPTQLDTIRSLEQQLAAAINKKLTAIDTAATAGLTVAAARAEMEAAVSAAQTAVDELSAVRNSRLDAAEAALEAASLSGQAAVQTAVDAQAAAEREAETAVSLINQLTTDLEQARQDAGFKIPIDEIVFLPALPARVEQFEVSIGESAVGPVLTVTNNQLAIDSSLPLDEARLVRPGMPVTIDEPDLGIEATGVVVRVAGNSGTDGVDGFHVYFETLVEETSGTIDGLSLRLTIPVEATEGMVTAVPVSALSLAADGTTRVQLFRNGGLEFVPVKPGLSADGFVEITPLDGTIAAGELVAIGYE